MPMLYTYAFTDDHPRLHMKTVLDVLWSGHENHPDDHARKLGVFIGNAGILDRHHPHFHDDVALLATNLDVEELGGDGVTVLSIVKENISDIDAGTWARFAKGAEPFLHVIIPAMTEEFSPR